MRSLRFWTIGTLLVAGAVLGLYRWAFPCGQRTCYLPCVRLGLVKYAYDHDGWFPSEGDDAFRSLTNLFPHYVYAEMLAGLSGNTRETENRVARGLGLTSAESSWVYQTGLRMHDSEEIALLWDRRGGIRGNGLRMRAGDHVVAFVSGEIMLIPREEWNTFTNRQAALRREAIAKRNGDSESNGLPHSTVK
jgi:hypothetical protein